MVPEYGPLLFFKGSDVWALGLHRVCNVYIRCPLFRAHIKGPCNYPKIEGLELVVFFI